MSLRNVIIVLLLSLMISRDAMCWDQSNEYILKGGFIYNFLKYIEWKNPEYSKTENINICIVGDTSKIHDLKKLDGKEINGRKININISNSDDIDKASCRVIFISYTAENEFEAVMKKTDKPGALIISDIEASANKGACIEMFMTAENKIKFKINTNIPEKKGIIISSQLLKLATLIQ